MFVLTEKTNQNTYSVASVSICY